jgi:tetratricopeptide (TPR) repeat protein
MNPNESDIEARIKGGFGGLEDYLWLGKVYMNGGDFNKLLELYEKTLNSLLRNEEKARIVYEKGEVLNILGRKEEALSLFERSVQLISREKETPSILYIKGMCHYNLSLLYNGEKGQQYARLSAKEFKQLTEKFPYHEENAVALLHLGHLCLKFNELDEAIKVYKKALEIAGDAEAKVWCLCGVASVYKEKGAYRKSEENYRQALEIAKGSKFRSNIYFEMGRMFFDSSQREKAIEAFRSALNYLKDDPVLRGNKDYLTDIYWHLGTLTYYGSDYDKAIGYLNKTLENIDQNHVYYCNSHITLGHSYVATGDLEKAQDHYRLVLLASRATEEELRMAHGCFERIGKEYTT